jgi:hypothetical protein
VNSANPAAYFVAKNSGEIPVKRLAVFRLFAALTLLPACFWAFAQSAQANEISISSPSLSLLEGDNGVLWYELKNLTDHDVTITSVGTPTSIFIGGDPSDFAQTNGWDPNGCNVGSIIPAGESCMLGLILLTSAENQENQDFGLGGYLVSVSVDNLAPVLGLGRAKILDTPEPGTLVLMALGVSGTLVKVRHRIRF